jgi:hypothetical protein
MSARWAIEECVEREQPAVEGEGGEGTGMALHGMVCVGMGDRERWVRADGVFSSWL